MISCPHCGAENADGSEFCTLCLAVFVARNPSAAARSRVPITRRNRLDLTSRLGRPTSHRETTGPMPRKWPSRPPNPLPNTGYYGTELQHQGGAASMRLPAQDLHMGKMEIAIMLLSYSLLTFLILFAIRFSLSIVLMGAAFGGSEAGFSIGMAVLFISDALVLAAGGSLISAKASQRGWGWLYGAGCAACTIFIWQSLASLVLMLLLTGEVYIPLFTLAGMLYHALSGDSHGGAGRMVRREEDLWLEVSGCRRKGADHEMSEMRCGQSRQRRVLLAVHGENSQCRGAFALPHSPPARREMSIRHRASGVVTPRCCVRRSARLSCTSCTSIA